MPKKSYTAIGNKIKRARLKAGFSRRELMMNLRTQGLDVTEATIYNWEREATTPDANEFMIVARVLSISLNFFCS